MVSGFYFIMPFISMFFCITITGILSPTLMPFAFCFGFGSIFIFICTTIYKHHRMRKYLDVLNQDLQNIGVYWSFIQGAYLHLCVRYP